ncbi:hypoxanthine phosphoribosyltransferase, partial [bacterium]
GFEVLNVFVFGYGLDWKQNFRGIRDIMALETSDEV